MKLLPFAIVLTALLTFSACSNPRISELGASSVLIEDHTHADIAYLADDRMEGREVGTSGERMSAKYIAQRMRDLGLRPAGINGTYLHEFYYGSNPHVPTSDRSTGIGYNVVGHLDKGKTRTIILGAHYDHLGHGGFGSLHPGDAVHNGADDNASGVAMMLELARRLANTPLNSNVLFIAFSGEEYGLLGSNAVSKSRLISDLDIAFMINMDMVGRYDANKGLAINGVGTSTVWPVVLEELRSADMKWVTSESGAGPSDHSVFYYMDEPVLSFFTGQHEDYHKPSDDIEKINFEGMTMVTELIENILVKADEFTDLPFTKTTEEDRESVSFKVSLGIMPDYLYDGEGLRIDGVQPERPAEAAGLMKGDIIKELGGKKVKDIYDYMEALNMHEPGQAADILIMRGEEKLLRTVQF